MSTSFSKSSIIISTPLIFASNALAAFSAILLNLAGTISVKSKVSPPVEPLEFDLNVILFPAGGTLSKVSPDNFKYS